MAKLIRKTIVFLGILSLITGSILSFGTSISYADDLEFIGDDLGLEITPESTKLFDLSNLNPGDIKEANITIKNNYIAPFELFMKAERTSQEPEKGNADLFKQLQLIIYLDMEIIYIGSMEDFAKASTSLGKFDSDDVGLLKAVVHLPGRETGNEFQGSNVDVKWTFIAQADELEEEFLGVEDIPKDDKDKKPEEKFLGVEDIKTRKLPKTGEIAPMAFYGIGTLLLGMGIVFGRKKRK